MMSNNCLKTSHSVFLCLADKKSTEVLVFNQSVRNCDKCMKRSHLAAGLRGTDWMVRV